MQDVVGRLFREFAITLAHRHRDLRRRLAHADADDVRAAAAATAKEGPDRQRPWRARSTRIIALYGRVLRIVLDHRAATMLVFLATLAATVVLYHGRGQGLLPRAGHRHHPGHRGGPAERLLCGDGPAPAGSSRGSCCEDQAVESVSSFIGVDGVNTTPNSGRMLINLKPRARTRGHRRADRRAGCRTGRRRLSRRRASSCSPCRISPSRTASAARSTSSRCSRRTSPRCKPGRRNCWSACKQSPLLADVADDLLDRGLQARVVIDRETAGAPGRAPPPPSTTRSTMPSASGSVSTIFTQSGPVPRRA